MGGNEHRTVEQWCLARRQASGREQQQGGHLVDRVAVLVNCVEPEANPVTARHRVYMRAANHFGDHPCSDFDNPQGAGQADR